MASSSGAVRENTYGAETLVGNWNEDRSDTRLRRRLRPLSSSVSHAYGTTSTYAYDWNRRSDVPAVREIVHIGARLAICAFSQIRKQENGSRHVNYPGHQPVLDLPAMKSECAQIISVTHRDFCHPNRQKPREFDLKHVSKC